MKGLFLYEFYRQARHFRGMMWTITFVNLSALIFFSLVGHFEPSEPNSILMNALGIMTLSSTITVSVSCIYGVVILTRLLLKDYIGDAREVIFLFPRGRTGIFLSKVIALSIHCFLMVLSILILENMIFYVVGATLGLLVPSLLVYGVKVICVGIFAGFFVLIVVLASILVGQLTQSLTSPMPVSILLVSIMGNFVAYLYLLSPFILLLLSIGAQALVSCMIYFLAGNIKRDDVLEHEPLTIVSKKN